MIMGIEASSPGRTDLLLDTVFPQTDSFFSIKIQEPANKVRLTGAICKCYNGDGRTVIKQALGD